MKKHPLQIICELDPEIGTTRSYSGRGMYGKECLGIVIYNTVGVFCAEILRALFNGSVRAANFSENEEFDRSDIAEEIAEALSSMCQDAMGLGTIVYFPSVPYVFEESVGDEDFA